MSVSGSLKIKKKSDIFVCVPSYNHANYIEQCLRSIISQTVSPRKLLVIDDGSKDDSAKIAERVLADCQFDSELIVRENRGLSRTLNQAFSLSDGKYFAYLGSDDIWLDGFLEERNKFLDERPDAVLAYGHAYLINEAGNAFDSTINYTDTYAREMILFGGAPISSTVVYRRSALDGVRWNDDARLEDYEMYLTLSSRGEFVFDPQILSAWRRHGTNTSSDNLMMLREILAAHERNTQSLGADGEELEKIQRRVRFQYARMELQYGNKSSALKLASESWRGARSPAELIKFYLRMLVPMALVEIRRRSRKEIPLKELRFE